MKNNELAYSDGIVGLGARLQEEAKITPRISPQSAHFRTYDVRPNHIFRRDKPPLWQKHPPQNVFLAFYKLLVRHKGI